MKGNLHSMKFMMTVLVIALFYSAVFAQDIPCAYDANREYAEQMKSVMPEFEQFKTSFHRNISSDSRISGSLKKNSIPIKIHIVRTNAGLTSLDTALMRKGFNYMNRLFEGSGLEFYICGTYNYINNSTYYDLNNTEYLVEKML